MRKITGHFESLRESYGYNFITPADGFRDLTVHPAVTVSEGIKTLAIGF